MENFSRGIVNFKKSNIVILSTRWTEKDLMKLPEVINFLKKNNKKIIVFNSIIDMSNQNSAMESLNKLTLVQQNYLKKLFPFQKYVYLNSKFPSSERDSNDGTRILSQSFNTKKIDKRSIKNYIFRK